MDCPAVLRAEFRDSIDNLDNERCALYLVPPWTLLINDIYTVNVSLSVKFISYIELINRVGAY